MNIFIVLVLMSIQDILVLPSSPRADRRANRIKAIRAKRRAAEGAICIIKGNGHTEKYVPDFDKDQSGRWLSFEFKTRQYTEYKKEDNKRHGNKQKSFKEKKELIFWKEKLAEFQS